MQGPIPWLVVKIVIEGSLALAGYWRPRQDSNLCTRLRR